MKRFNVHDDKISNEDNPGPGTYDPKIIKDIVSNKFNNKTNTDFYSYILKKGLINEVFIFLYNKINFFNKNQKFFIKATLIITILLIFDLKYLEQ